MNANSDDSIELPAGFRFHPTDEELITHYLSPKSLDDKFTTFAIGDADLNKVEPWDLPWRASFGEEEWYFFFERDRKYPTGLRTNRATRAGYWKATGKDKDIIHRSKARIGMKKTLVFYRGRAPKGEKTNWVMHEYRLEGESSAQNRKEWVLCRVFEKRSGGERVHISGLIRNRASDEEDDTRTNSSDLPPLTDLSSSEAEVKNQKKVLLGYHNSHGTCFSNHEVEKYDHLPRFASTLPAISDSKSIFTVEFAEYSSCPDSYMVHEDRSGLGISSENGNGEESVEQNRRSRHQREDVYGHDLGFKCSWEEDDQVNLDCLWNY